MLVKHDCWHLLGYRLKSSNGDKASKVSQPKPHTTLRSRSVILLIAIAIEFTDEYPRERLEACQAENYSSH